MSDRDRHLLERAAFEAVQAGWLGTAPNPRVGALALQGGHVIGSGHHERYGGAHAEENALRDAGAWDADHGRPLPDRVDEMVVSLEPCSARGGAKKRPPCTELLRAAGVKRLLVGAVDPDPRHRGAGLEELRASGAAVELREDGAELFEKANAAFLRALARNDRPWVLAKWAASFDGKTATDGGVSQWITGPEARQEVHGLRAASDAVLAGPGTLRADDPRLTARPAAGRSLHQPLRVLLWPDGRVPEAARVFQEAGPRLWLLAENAEPSGPLAHHLAEDADRALSLPTEADGRVDVRCALRALHEDFGVRRILVEGGPRLHGRLADDGLLDAVVRYEAPLLLGGSHGAILGAGCEHPERGLRLEQEERAQLGPDLRRAFLVRGAP